LAVDAPLLAADGRGELERRLGADSWRHKKGDDNCERESQQQVQRMSSASVCEVGPAVPAGTAGPTNGFSICAARAKSSLDTDLIDVSNPAPGGTNQKIGVISLQCAGRDITMLAYLFLRGT